MNHKNSLFFFSNSLKGILWLAQGKQNLLWMICIFSPWMQLALWICAPPFHVCVFHSPEICLSAKTLHKVKMLFCKTNVTTICCANQTRVTVSSFCWGEEIFESYFRVLLWLKYLWVNKPFDARVIHRQDLWNALQLSGKEAKIKENTFRKLWEFQNLDKLYYV